MTKLELQHLTIGYGRTRRNDSGELLRDVSLAAPAGELIALLGRNGTGKSTLLRTLSGVRKPVKGHVLIDGKDIFGLTPRELSRLVSTASTDNPGVAHLNAGQLVAMGRAPYTGWLGSLAEDDRRAVAAALDAVGMTSFAAASLDTLSDGERGRVMIARALAQDTPVVLLDEPTAFLDVPNRHQITRLLASLAHATGKLILFSSHDLATVLEFADRLWILDGGGIIDTTPAEIAQNGDLERIFGISG